MNSVRDEFRFLFSGMGMPYEKVAITVALIITVLFTIFFGNNFAEKSPVVVVDLDQSRYSRELTEKIDTSPYMHVTGVVETPADPTTFFYEDRAYAVIYLPEGLEKAMYGGGTYTIGLFADNTNTALSAGVTEALNGLIAAENAEAGAAGGGTITLSTRKLFNPVGSTSNGTTEGFLFFFSSMYFVFATIGMVPRLRLEKKWETILRSGSPLDLAGRLVPYGCCLLVALLIGMAVLRLWGDMVISGNILLFIVVQFFYIAALGLMSILFGWGAANPGIAASRMVLFVAGGFIWGGATAPISLMPSWVVTLSHFFPLTWEFHFVRDILMRGAGFTDLMTLFGEFLLYLAAIILFLVWKFEREKGRVL